jgi:uncharacterized membrane protein (UPF0127 family)
LNLASLGRRMRLALFLALGLSGSAVAACPQPPQSLRTEPMTLATHAGVVHLTVEVADTDLTREIGLMCRTALAPDRGMLFDFKSPQPVQFWMKNTLIPLDMLFIGADGRVISIAANARPMDETAIPARPVVALGVLEIPGGRAAQLHIRPGDVASARIFHP